MSNNDATMSGHVRLVGAIAGMGSGETDRAPIDCSGSIQLTPAALFESQA